MDANLEYDHRTKEGTYAGFNKSTVTPNPFVNTAQTTTFATYSAASPTVYSYPNTNTAFKDLYFSLPLVGSGILNMTSDAHNAGSGALVPLALIQGLVLELQLSSNLLEIFDFSTPISGSDPIITMSVDEVSYDATIVEFEQSFINEMKQQMMAAGGSVFLSSYTYHGQSISSSSEYLTLQMNERAKSIKSIYVIPRLNSQNTQSNSVFASPAPTNNGTINAYLLIGSQQYPNQAYNYLHECFNGFKNSVGGGVDGIIDKQSYESTAVATLDATRDSDAILAGTATQGRFTLGWDLETISAKEMMIENGLNNSLSSIPISVNFRYNSGVARTFVLASMVDMIVQIDVMNRSVRTSY
jgi:hypothetical protein